MPERGGREREERESDSNGPSVHSLWDTRDCISHPCELSLRWVVLGGGVACSD